MSKPEDAPRPEETARSEETAPSEEAPREETPREETPRDRMMRVARSRPSRTGAEQPWEPEDLAAAEGRDPTKENVERAKRELEEEGPAAIERNVP